MRLFKNILYVADAEPAHASSIARAVSLAEKSQARLAVIQVLSDVPEEYRDGMKFFHTRALESLIEPYRGRVNIESRTVTGIPFLEVIRAVLHNGHDLVIKNAEEPDFMKKLFGSDDMHLLRKCPCPVWLMRSLEKDTYTTVLAALDFNPLIPEDMGFAQALNREILELAGLLALSDKASLHLVHAWEAYAETLMRFTGDISHDRIADHVRNQHLFHQKGFHQMADLLRERIGADAYNSLSPSFHMPKGPAKRMIPELAATLQADLVVMGTISRTGIAGLIIGNTAETILDQLRCAVLAVKPPGFVTPVQI